jgi:hypothetical protein
MNYKDYFHSQYQPLGHLCSGLRLVCFVLFSRFGFVFVVLGSCHLGAVGLVLRGWSRKGRIGR